MGRPLTLGGGEEMEEPKAKPVPARAAVPG